MSVPEQSTPQNGVESFERCEQCHAPVDRDQRYCVNCGTHRRAVPDPAARYMSQVTSHTAARAGASGAASGRRGYGEIGVLGALALALIPVAAAVGIAVGRSSNNQDAKLYSALERQHAQTTTTLVGSSARTASSGGSSVSTGTTATVKPRTKPKAAKAARHKPAAVSSTSNGKVAKVSGAKITAAQQAQGSSEAKKVQGSTGKNYVQANNNLPSSVVVGP